MPESRTKSRRAYQRHRLDRKRGDSDESNEIAFGDVEMNPISGEKMRVFRLMNEYISDYIIPLF